ncbi:MAG TPA: HAMP domain-containing sensor histidine kinase [Polyangia bacterium]|nr:HAMP domain-containing sensor histidine kinase [Polyangia bacterium]
MGTGLLLVLAIWAIAAHFLNVHDRVWESRNRNRELYAELVADRIGTPPNLEIAKQIVAQTGMDLKIQGSDCDFATQPISPIEHPDAGHRCVWEPSVKVVSRAGRIFVELTRPGYTFLFSYENDTFLDERPEWWPMLIGVFLLALTLNYVAIRMILKPLQWLSDGVSLVHQGQLNVQIRTGKDDELGDLTSSFNEMTREIARMLSSREQLLLDVSHELRSPITRLKVALELDDDLSKEQVHKSIRDLEVMISELLESARLDAARGGLSLQETDVDGLVQDVAAKLAGTKPGVVVDPIAGHLKFSVDPKRIEIALKNVLENAITHSRHQDLPVQVRASEEGDAIVIAVRDHGHGIPAGEQTAIFEPFYRVDKSRVRETGGYGLGLALCRKIMAAHGGSIEVTESGPRGTTFTFRFKRRAS